MSVRALAESTEAWLEDSRLRRATLRATGPCWLAVAVAAIALLATGPGPSSVPGHSDPAAPAPAAAPPSVLVAPTYLGERGPAGISPPSSERTAVVPALTWRNITSESSNRLPVFWFTEGTWDTADHSLVYYGGDNFAGTNLQTTESYAGGGWSPVATSGTNPGPLDGPALAYDPAANSVVMYGGLVSYSPFNYTNLTYLYSGGVWSGVHLNPTPPPRLAGSMAYDPDLGGVVLFGGYNNSDPSGSTVLNDLWLYKAGAWSRLPDASPPPVRTWASLAYDSTLHALVLYGGINAAFGCYGDTWTYNGTWTHVVTPGGPTALLGTELVYDPDVGHVILTGGDACPATPNTGSWAFNGTAWNALAVTGTPESHLYGVAAWDPVAGMLVVAGGQNSSPTTDVLSAPFQLVNASGPASGEVGQLVSFQARVTGGVPARGFTWDWGDRSPISAGSNSSHSYASTGTFSVRFQASDATGVTVYWNRSIVVVAGVTAQISSSSTVLDVGLNATFTASILGGSGSPTYVWTFGDGGTANGTIVSHAYAAPGPFTVVVVATDLAGATGNASESVQVFAALEATLSTPARADVGISVQLRGTVFGGAPPLSYGWVLDDGSSGTSVLLAHAFSAPGDHGVQFAVHDGANVTVVANAVVDVAPQPVLTVTGPTSLSTGETGTWSANVTGGSGPFQTGWDVAGVANGTGPTAALSFATAGSYTIVFLVNDSANGTAHATLHVLVSTPPSFFGTSVGGVPVWGLLAVVAAIVVVAVAAALVLRRRRGDGPST